MVNHCKPYLKTFKTIHCQGDTMSARPMQMSHLLDNQNRSQFRTHQPPSSHLHATAVKGNRPTGPATDPSILSIHGTGIYIYIYTVYNHNMPNMDSLSTTPDLIMSVPWMVSPVRPCSAPPLRWRQPRWSLGSDRSARWFWM